MTDQIVSKRYALALFNAAESAGEGLTEQVQKELSFISDLWEKNAELRAFFEAPQIPGEDKEKMLQLTFRGKISELLLQFLLFLLSKGRLVHILEINTRYDQLLKEKEGLVEAQVITASPLDEGLSVSLKEKMEKKTGKKVSLTYKVEPEIIGGIRVIVGNQIIDHSIRTELDKLRESLLSLKV
ncbi:MAG: ATP synthase F1 subunit delta [candidate division Zixibacteria bacterium RBG_16_43_9]|nr:MAG: ATP synthase F1 subunit delta [candidate division Zixibacteria bacterium RBG_16_43_9]